MTSHLSCCPCMHQVQHGRDCDCAAIGLIAVVRGCALTHIPHPEGEENGEETMPQRTEPHTPSAKLNEKTLSSDFASKLSRLPLADLAFLSSSCRLPVRQERQGRARPRPPLARPRQAW